MSNYVTNGHVLSYGQWRGDKHHKRDIHEGPRGKGNGREVTISLGRQRRIAFGFSL